MGFLLLFISPKYQDTADSFLNAAKFTRLLPMKEKFPHKKTFVCVWYSIDLFLIESKMEEQHE